MGGLDKTTIIIWLVTALIAAGGGSIGTSFVKSSDRFYGREGRALQTEVVRLKTELKTNATNIQGIQNQQGIMKYRQDECIGELKVNEDEHRDLQALLHRIERIEWEVAQISKAPAGV